MSKLGGEGGVTGKHTDSRKNEREKDKATPSLLSSLSEGLKHGTVGNLPAPPYAKGC